MTGRISNQPTIVLSYPVRDGQGALVGVLGLGLNLTRLQTLFSDIPLPDGSVVTLSDKGSRVLARSRDAELYIGKSADPHPTAPRDVPRTQVRTGLDNVERSYGNAVVDRGPWLLSVGIPTSVGDGPRRAAASAATWRSSPPPSARSCCSRSACRRRCRAASTACAPRCSGSPTATCRRPSGAPLPNRELAQLQEAFITMAANLREAHLRARSSGRAGAQDARDAAVAAAAGRPSGASGRRRRARLRRRARAEQSAAGDPRHAGAARARPRHLAGGARRDRVREDAERPRARDHPQPVAVQQPAVGTADAGRSPRRHRRSRAAAAPRPRFVQHRAQRRRADRSEGLRQLHRGRAGDAELRHQRAAVDRGRRPRRAAASSSASSTPASACASKCRTMGPA